MARAMNDYINDGKKIYDGQYATKLADMQRVKSERLLDYDNSNKSLNSQYDQSLVENKKDGITRIHNYNNNTLARGLGRSTIATTGIAGIENTTAQNANKIQTERAAKIADLMAQRNNYLSDYDRQVRALNDEKQSAINKYAIDAYNRDVDYDRQQALAAASRASSYSGGSSSSGNSNTVRSTLANEVNYSVSNLKDFAQTRNLVEQAYLQGYISDDERNTYLSRINGTMNAMKKSQASVNKGTYNDGTGRNSNYRNNKVYSSRV